MNPKPHLPSPVSTPDAALGGAELGGLIRDLRRRKGYTLAQLAEATQRSLGFLSQIERGLSRPTVEDLTVLQQTLGVPTSYFFTATPVPEGRWFTRPSERRVLNYAHGITDHLLSPALSGGLCLLETVLEPGADTGERSLLDAQEQGGYVLEGEVDITVGSQVQRLQANDAFAIPANEAVALRNPGPGAARLLWALMR